MGKSLKELLNDKEKGLLVPADGLGSTPPPTPPQPDFIKGKFKSLLLGYNMGLQINRVNSDIVFLKNFPKVALTQYGLDAPRILTHTDPHKQKKAIKKAADKIGPAIGGRVGAVVGGVASAIASFKPKYPDDFTIGEDGNPTGMESRFYSNGLINGDYARGFYYNPYHNNSKSKVGKFFGAAKTPGQIKDAAIAAAKSAAIGLAVAAAGLLIKKVFTKKNKKKGKSDEPQGNKPNNKPSTGFKERGKINSPYFPSTLAINSGFKSGVTLGSYSRYSRANFNIGAIDYLNSSTDTILEEISPTVKESDILPGYIDKERNLDSYYASLWLKETPQTRNKGNVILSADFLNNNYYPTFTLDNVNKKDGLGYYSAYKKENYQGNSLDDKIGNFSKFIDKEGNAFIFPGDRTLQNYYINNDISKVSSLHQNYGGGETNLLTIKVATNNDKLKLDTLGDPLDPTGNFYTWQSQGASYTKDFLSDKNTTIHVSGENYANEVGNDRELINTSDGLNQYFGYSDINLLENIDADDPLQNKFKYKDVLGNDVVSRFNSRKSPFSSNAQSIYDKRKSEINNSTQTQTNTPIQINPYLTTKKNVLQANETDYLKVKIAGINFLSILTSFSDKSTSNWDSVKPVGSGLNFYLFNNWERDISFDLKLYANNKVELKQMWQKVNNLQKLTMGNPSSKGGAAYGVYGNIVTLVIGDLIKETGFLADINMTVEDVSPWEIDNKSQAPFICTISVSFKVVTNKEGNEYNFYEIAKA